MSSPFRRWGLLFPPWDFAMTQPAPVGHSQVPFLHQGPPNVWNCSFPLREAHAKREDQGQNCWLFSSPGETAPEHSSPATLEKCADLVFFYPRSGCKGEFAASSFHHDGGCFSWIKSQNSSQTRICDLWCCKGICLMRMHFFHGCDTIHWRCSDCRYYYS